MKDPRSYTEANRQAWNAAMQVHRQHRGDRMRHAFATAGFSLLDETLHTTLRESGLEGARLAHLCCNNGVELLSALNLGAAQGVGFDISDEAIREADELARIAGLPARFVRSDVYDIDPGHDAGFDLVLFTVGGLCWLPDLPAVFRVAWRLLVPRGRLVIYDQHPITRMLPTCDEQGDGDARLLKYPYFTKEPIVETTGIDYLGHTRYDAPPSYDFQQTLGEILGGVLGAGFRIRVFSEYGHDISNLFSHLESDAAPPLCYRLVAEKESVKV